MQLKKKRLTSILREMSWQDRIFGIFILAAAVILITLGMTLVGSDGVLILLGAMCLYFVTSVYRINKEKDTEDAPVVSSENPQAAVENLIKQRPEDKRRELASNLLSKKTEDKHKGLMGDLMGKR